MKVQNQYNEVFIVYQFATHPLNEKLSFPICIGGTKNKSSRNLYILQISAY